MKLIDKDALVAEIEKRVGFNKALNAYSRADECNAILSFLDTLEVKGVDLEKEISEYFVEHSDEFFSDKYKLIAKHFFELGVNASNPLTWEDISMIREIFCGMVGYPLMTDKEVCKEVLKRFKEQKGE